MSNEVHNLGTLPPGPRVFEASTLGMPPGFWPEVVAANGKLWRRETLDDAGAKYKQVDGPLKLLIAND